MRPTPLLASALVTLAVIGCGGGDVPEPKPKRYSAQHVVTFFGDVTGDPLETSTNPSFDSISVDHGDSDRANVMDARYGSFLIYVLRRPGSDSIYKTQEGRPVKPDPNGVYWHDEGGSWQAMKPYSNVVLSWSAEDKVLGDGFARLDAVLSQLGKPAEQVRARMSPDDRSCGEQPVAGTCRGDNGATVTTVERDERLTLENLEVKVVRVETGRLVIPPRDYGLVRRAKGRYVLAALRIKNTGNEPLRGLYDVRLKIGDKIYDQSSEATWTATPMDAFPVQPDDSSVAALVFDVPIRAAREATEHGVLAFPAGDDLASVEDAPKLGQIRLAKPGSGANA
jgi:Domain of unknown function (DUF4352)